MTVLTDAGRAAKRAYKRTWDKNHREHNKIYQANYWNRKATEQQENNIKKDGE